MALGARRLSIVDLAGGRQPIGNEDGRSGSRSTGNSSSIPSCVRSSSARGHRLATRCDTEAWVHLYEDHGEGMFEKARGQFAVSLWDRIQPDAHPGSRPGGHLPALLRRARRLAALGLGDQGAARLGLGRRRGPTRCGMDHLFTFFCAGRPGRSSKG